ncbi:hypothetical protein Marpi_1799 [Marinitoga piezophila KA3]|uniref:Uncharacterized protein n=1 Tax=Marinitoga piezophila (strain DSM 14283 / JCM 11233 / KA3) TaxID=443254 RepID=H2J5W1_MARPK|nr:MULTISPECIES: hypothetical protein [Marinitoga]AEX86180.1 hypothetical protein Marpi_1799 [Marinitoga piezophila KA3]APT76594.1 hypothetical protein LN42_09560 [Marinitoga sp. 1137]NUU98290.1 hypothetical protein [Marinitoga sp. 1138]
MHLKKEWVTFIIMLLSFTGIMLLSNMIFDHIFQKEPYLYYGSLPIESKNLKYTKTFPKKAKAVLSLEDNIMKIYIPKNTRYFDNIFKDIKVFLYDASLKKNTIVKPYFIDSPLLKPPDIYNRYIKILGIIIFVFISLSGYIFSFFNKNNLRLLLLHYYPEILKRFLIFIAITFSYIGILFILRNDLNLFLLYIVMAFVAILLTTISNKSFLNLIIYVAVYNSLYFFEFYNPNIKALTAILIVALVINISLNYFQIIKTNNKPNNKLNKGDANGIL